MVERAIYQTRGFILLEHYPNYRTNLNLVQLWFYSAMKLLPGSCFQINWSIRTTICSVWWWHLEGSNVSAVLRHNSVLSFPKKCLNFLLTNKKFNPASSSVYSSAVYFVLPNRAVFIQEINVQELSRTIRTIIRGTGMSLSLRPSSIQYSPSEKRLQRGLT